MAPDRFREEGAGTRGAEVKSDARRNSLLKGTFRLQSTLTCFISSDTVSFLLASSVYRCKRPNVNTGPLQNRNPTEALLLIHSRGSAPRGRAHPLGVRGARTSLARCQSAPSRSTSPPRAPPSAAPSSPPRDPGRDARRPLPLSAQARQLGRRTARAGRGVDAAGEDGAGERGPHREGAAAGVSKAAPCPRERYRVRPAHR